MRYRERGAKTTRQLLRQMQEVRSLLWEGGSGGDEIEMKRKKKKGTRVCALSYFDSDDWSAPFKCWKGSVVKDFGEKARVKWDNPLARDLFGKVYKWNFNTFDDFGGLMTVEVGDE